MKNKTIEGWEERFEKKFVHFPKNKLIWPEWNKRGDDPVEIENFILSLLSQQTQDLRKKIEKLKVDSYIEHGNPLDYLDRVLELLEK